MGRRKGQLTGLKEGRKPRRLDVQAGLLPWDIEVEQQDESVTSFAGLPAAIEAFEAFGLNEAIEAYVKTQERRRGPSDAEWIRLFTMLHLSGGKCITDMEALTSDAGLRRIWPVLEDVKERSSFNFLYRFDDGEKATPGKAVIRKETAPLEGLGRVRDHLVAVVQALNPESTATLDADASIHETSKREALWTYGGTKGYQPFCMYWAEQALIVRDQFRDGNVGAGFETLPEIQAAFATLPPGVSTRRFRSDSACYEHKTLRWLDRNEIGFAVTADMSRQLKQACMELPKDAWKPLRWRNAKGKLTETDRQWAEVPYVPSDGVARKGERPFRYLAIRVPQQRDLFGEQSEAWRYFAVVTNRSGAGDKLIRWHRQRAGTVEAAHDKLKNDTGARVLPSNKFGANAAWYRIAVLACNLQVAMSHGMPQEWKKRRLSSWQYRMLRAGGRITKHARRLTLTLAAGCRAIAEAISGLRVFLRKRVKPVAFVHC